MCARPYDRERDDQAPLEEIVDLVPIDQQLNAGLSHHIVRLAVALEAVLEPSTDDEEERARVTLARQALDEYEAWFSTFKAHVDEQWHARFGEPARSVH